MMDMDEILDLGLYPLEKANEEIFELLNKEKLFKLFHSIEEAKESVEKSGIPIEEAYLTSGGLSGLMLFDGKWTLTEYYPMGSNDDVLLKNWNRYKKTTNKEIENHNYESVIHRIPVAYKKKMIEIHLDDIPEQLKRKLLLDIRQKSEYQFEEFDENIFIPEMIRSKEKAEDLLMLRKKHSKQALTIYRGQTTKSTDLEYALSWTLDLKIARFFADRFSSKGVIYQAEVDIEEVLAYSESESEVLIQYDSLRKIKKIASENA